MVTAEVYVLVDTRDIGNARLNRASTRTVSDHLPTCCMNGSLAIETIVTTAPRETRWPLSRASKSSEPQMPRLAESNLTRSPRGLGRENHNHLSWLIAWATGIIIATLRITANMNTRAFINMANGQSGSVFPSWIARVITIASKASRATRQADNSTAHALHTCQGERLVAQSRFLGD